MKEEKLNHMPHSEGRYTDPLDFALAARPVVKAPSGTSQKVLARLAILEQQKQSVITAATTQSYPYPNRKRKNRSYLRPTRVWGSLSSPSAGSACS
jgi:hypothetical protein